MILYFSMESYLILIIFVCKYSIFEFFFLLQTARYRINFTTLWTNICYVIYIYVLNFFFLCYSSCYLVFLGTFFLVYLHGSQKGKLSPWYLNKMVTLGKIGARIGSNLCYLICLRLFLLKESFIRFVLPFNISIMAWAG